MRPALVVVLATLAVASGALAANGDPQQRITPADQARAKSMLLRASDFNPAFTERPSPSGDSGFSCAAIDESDLTITGRATSPSFTATAEYVASTAVVYESRADANASWKRGTSKAGLDCLGLSVRRQLRAPGVRFVSFTRISFPGRGDRSVAFRAIAAQQSLRVYLDVVAMQVARAEASVAYVSVLSPPPQGEVRRLTAVVAKRAARAMRGPS
jgi:hypothetical protein